MCIAVGYCDVCTSTQYPRAFSSIVAPHVWLAIGLHWNKGSFAAYLDEAPALPIGRSEEKGDPGGTGGPRKRAAVSAKGCKKGKRAGNRAGKRAWVDRASTTDIP